MLLLLLVDVGVVLASCEREKSGYTKLDSESQQAKATRKRADGHEQTQVLNHAYPRHAIHSVTG